MKHKVFLIFLFVFSSFINAQQDTNTEQDFVYDETQQLKNFSRLVGGKWWLNGNSYQTFEWGISDVQVRVQRVIVEEGLEIIVNEGFFYFAPDALSIKGIAISIIDNEPPQLLEYIGNTTPETFELMYKSIDPDGQVVVYSETWTRINEDKYHWRLESFDKDTSVIEGEYVRKYD